MADAYYDARSVHPLGEKGPTEQFLDNIRDFWNGLTGRKKKTTAARDNPPVSAAPVNVRKTTTPPTRNIVQGHVPAAKKIDTAASESNTNMTGPLVCNPQYTTMTKNPSHHIAFVQHDETNPAIIRTIAVNLAGPNEAPKIVTLGPDERMRLKKAMEFIDNDLLDPAVSLRGRRNNNEPRPRV